MRKSQDYMVRGGFSTAANAGGALFSTVRALPDREATLRRFKTCTLRVFDYDEDGGLTSRSAYKLVECPLTVLVSLFEQITAVLPFEDWGRLYYYELGHALNREL